MLSESELDAIEKDHYCCTSTWIKLIAQAREANRFRRDAEAMGVLQNFPNDGLTVRGDRNTWYVQNDNGGRCGPIASSPTDALLAWKEKYGGREANDGCAV